MNKEGIDQRTKRRFGGGISIVAVAVIAVVLGGCSSVPDAVNPVKWYENTADYLSGDKAKKDEANKTQTPGANEAFPNLATVPDKPQVSSAEERDKIAQGLVGDREGRRYASEVQHQGAPTHVLGSESGTAETAPQTGTSTPVPALPVASAPAPAVTPKSTETATTAMVPSAPPPTSPPPPPSLTASASAPAPNVPAPMLSAPKTPAMAQATNVPPRLNWPVGSGPGQQPTGPDSFETVVVSSSGVSEMTKASPIDAPKDSLMVSRRDDTADRVGDQKGSIKVATIQFARGSSMLNARDRAILRQVVALQHERGGVIRVVGHASSHTRNMDPISHKLVNYDVSSARAETVAKALAELGARTKDVVVVAKSDTDPLYYEFMPSGEAGNRRTEVYLDF